MDPREHQLNDSGRVTPAQLADVGTRNLFQQDYPDFDTLFDPHVAEPLTEIWNAIEMCDLWDWMRSYRPEKAEQDKGYVFSKNPKLMAIRAQLSTPIDDTTFRSLIDLVIQILRRGGWDRYRGEELAAQVGLTIRRSPPCPCRAMRGFLSGWCGVAGGGVPACDH